MNRNNIVFALLACFSLVIPVQATVCELPDNGQGTADLPPDCPGGYTGHMAIVDGLPPGTTVEVDAVLRDFTSVVRTPGGSLGGEIQTWNGLLEMDMAGTGTLAGFSRFIVLPVYGESHSAPRILGQPAQSFTTDLVVFQGQILGDPDFDLLRVTGGTGYGLPSPGHTTLTRLPGGNWSVDSFFDITYRIDFVGAPGGQLPGLSGSTTNAEHFVAGEPAPPLTVCELPDNGMGTIDLPPDCPGGYQGHMAIVDGLPSGTTVEIDAILRYFTNVVRTPGGYLGGETQTWDAQLEMALTGTGILTGFYRYMVMPVQGETHSAPGAPYQFIQSFDTEMVRLFGQVLGDPDFDLLRVIGGSDFGLPSPGHTTLMQLHGGRWAVDSFFDITYRIDFVGRPGGYLSGYSGSTTGVEHFVAGDGFAAQGIEDGAGCGLCFPQAAEGSPGAGYALFANTPNPFGPATTIEYYVPASGGPVTLEVFDVTGHVVRTLVRERQGPGLKRVTWDGRGDEGAQIATGVYFYRLRAPGFEKALKMMVIQ
jgi:hypothetical protein